jgi:hypothetical protein
MSWWLIKPRDTFTFYKVTPLYLLIAYIYNTAYTVDEILSAVSFPVTQIKP